MFRKVNMNDNGFVIGEETSFSSHGNQWTGVIEKITNNSVTLSMPVCEYQHPPALRRIVDDVEVEYRTFQLNSIKW